jgi:hypothetical protein
MIQWGLISKLDSETLMKTIDLICDNSIKQEINTCEIGVYDGMTSRGINEYVLSKNIKCNHTAIDNEKDKPILKPFPECKLIIGDSKEVYNQIPDNSQHLCFIDGDHSLLGVIADFFAYADKVKVGAYLAFHDTGAHINPFKDFQHGDKENPNSYISVRKALKKIGLLPTMVDVMLPKKVTDELDVAAKEFVSKFENCGVSFPHYVSLERKYVGWKLIFDEADKTNPAGGVTVFQKMH